MIDRIEVSINIYIHVTEDITKIFQAVKELLAMKEEDVTIHETTVYFDNPIIILNAEIVKNEYQNYMNKLFEFL